jgi:hypothetical protein
MTSDVIEKFVENKDRNNVQVNIHFKQRNTVTGLFIKMNDYTELKRKNFWRIISNSKVEEYEKTKDASLARIFNGAEFTRLTESKQ